MMMTSARSHRLVHPVRTGYSSPAASPAAATEPPLSRHVLLVVLMALAHLAWHSSTSSSVTAAGTSTYGTDEW